MVIPDCELTHQTSQILSTWNVGKKSSDSHLGVDVQGEEVYSLCFCTISAISTDNDGFLCVTTQYDDLQCIRYCHLTDVNVELAVGQAIAYGTFIGHCKNHVHLEYGVSTTVYTNSVIRCGQLTYYKADPMPLLESRKDMVYDYREDEDYIDLSYLPEAKLDEVTESVLDEFEGGYDDE